MNPAQCFTLLVFGVLVSLTDTCTFENAPSNAKVYKGKSCEELITATDQHLCYESFIRKHCCVSCEAAKTGIASCEYGDRASWCSTLSSEGCYDNEETCCGTCKKYETSIPSCEYGDRASWCSTISANACHLHGDTCCRSCADQQSVTIAAPAPAPTAAPAPAPTAAPEPAIRATGTNLDSQGRVCYDRTYWCPTVSPWNCYTTWMNDACCGTCKKYVTSVPNCKYGDRWFGCDKLLVYPRKCYMYENECCSWCAQHETGNATCKYGDKVRECHTGHCLRWADDCCGTCG